MPGHGSEGSSASSRPQGQWKGPPQRRRPNQQQNGQVPVCSDMEQLRAAIAQARAGTGMVAAILSHSTIQPREPAFTKLIQGCVPHQDYQKAMELWEIMRSAPGLKPNMITYSVLIHVCAATGRVKEAEDFFRLNLEAAKGGEPDCQPNHITYSSLLTACTRGKRLDRALHWYEHMQRAGVEPDNITYSSLIVSCLESSRGGMTRALAIMDDMHTVGQLAMPETYSRLLHSLGDSGDWSKATEVFLCAQMAGIGLSIDVCTALLSVYEACRQPAAAKQLMEAFPKEAGPIPRDILMAGLKAFETTRAWRHALSLWESVMKEMKIHDPAAARALLNILEACGQHDQAAKLAEEFQALGIEARQPATSA